MSFIKPARRLIAAAALVALVSAGCSSGDDATKATTTSSTSTTTAVKKKPAALHAFVINLENESFDSSWGPTTEIPYLATTLKKLGLFLPNYYGVAHVSLGNYIAQVSGQGPDKAIQSDCLTYSDFVQSSTADYQQAVGDGCVFPASVKTIADQLADAGKTWKAYQEDLSAGPEKATTCRHPEIGKGDPTLLARPKDMYATRHDPFVYFHSIIDGPACDNVVDFSTFADDLKTEATTPNLSYITPNLCNDGHDDPCKDGKKGGMARANTWLSTWVPKILASPAFAKSGMLIITFDEAESSGPKADASACCGITSTPNAPQPGLSGPGGGKVGALVLTPGGREAIDETPYNHYSLLCTLEESFDLPKLGYAGHPDTKCFTPKGGGGSALMP